MRALVTGSAGFIGRHISRALEEAGHVVIGCDLADGRDCRDLFSGSQSFDLVVHCAALVDGRETIDGRPALIAAYNLQLDASMFEWALRTRPRRIVYFSSSAAYPIRLQTRAHHRPLNERDIDLRDTTEPDQTYGFVKLSGERIAAEVRTAGVPVTVIRPFSGYGSDQDPRYPFPAIIGRAHRREIPFVVWGDGRQVRDFIHVDDITAGVLTLIDNDVDGPINLGTGRGTSIDQLATLAMRSAGHHAPLEHRGDKPAGVHSRVADTARLRCHYIPKITLEDGVERALSACATR